MTTTPAKKAPAKKAAASRIPAGVRKPQDRKPRAATRARMAEAADGFVTIEQNGMVFDIPVTQETLGSKVVLGALMGDTNDEQLLKLIGKDKLEAFVNMDPEPSADDLLALFEKVKEALGQGN